MDSSKRLARVAGLLYLIVAIFGGFSELYVRSSVKVAGDAAATAENIAAAATLMRVGFVADLVNIACFLVLALVLYRLLKHVSAGAAVTMLVFTAVSVAVMTFNMVNHLGAIEAATNPDFPTSFGGSSDTLATWFLEMHSYGYLVAGVFFGLWLLPLGYMLFRSGYAPRALATLVMVGSLGYVADVIASALIPSAPEAMRAILVMPSVIAELSLIVWLMAKGLRTPERDEKVPHTIERVVATT